VLILYSFLLTVAMIIMSPLFLLRRQKYASGFRERLGNYPEFKHDDRRVIWLHSVSVGETNAARPLVDELLKNFPSHRLVVSTTTRTGQELARNTFKDKADAVFYFPFDWKFSVRRALRTFKPSVILLMETEIWPRLIVEAKRSGVKVAIVNGRLSERSFRRYSWAKTFISKVLQQVDVALMQSEKDAERIQALGLDASKIRTTGNLKFDISVADYDAALVDELRHRFGLDGSKPLIVAASTHEPEEERILQALDKQLGDRVRLLIAPRHPERFDHIAKLLDASQYSFARRSEQPKDDDRSADIILLDTIGELRSVYLLADIVFVGGSLIPHGGQSILEPGAAGKAIVTGPFTHNFTEAVKIFRLKDAIIQLNYEDDAAETLDHLKETLTSLINHRDRRDSLGKNASSVIRQNRGAVETTVQELKDLLD